MVKMAYMFMDPYQLNIQENVFSSNCRNDITLDLDCLYNRNNNNINNNNLNNDFYTKINEYKSINNVQKIYELSNVIINK